MKAVVSSRRHRRTTRLSMFLIMLMAVSLIAGMVGCGSATDTVVTFSDANLEAAIREALSKPSGPIYAAELARLPSLSAHDRGVEELSGIQYCVNLTGLDLNYDQISDISPLVNLVNLISLGLRYNQIFDISPLANLANITALNLATNEISDVSPLANLTSLTHLYLDYNELADISPLANLTSLKILDLGYNEISDILPLVDNEGLSEGDLLNLTGNPLSSDSVSIYIPQLEERGVIVSHQNSGILVKMFKGGTV